MLLPQDPFGDQNAPLGDDGLPSDDPKKKAVGFLQNLRNIAGRDLPPTDRFSGTDLSEYTPFTGPQIDPFKDDIEEMRAQGQSGGYLLKNATIQALGEIVGGAIEGTGYLLDIPDVMGLFQVGDEAWGNALSEFGRNIKEGSRDVAPIFQTREAQGGLAPGDPTWWASHAPSIASTLSLMIPSLGVTKGLSKGAQMLAKLTGGAVPTVARTAGEAVTAGLLSRHMEGMMEGAETWDHTYLWATEQRMEDGSPRYNEFQARQLADEAAANTYRKGYWLAAVDMLQYGSILKAGQFANRNLRTAAKQAAGKAAIGETPIAADLAEAGIKKLDFLKQMVAEGSEEMFQEAVQKDSDFRIKFLTGEAFEDGGFFDRVGEALTDPKSWDAFIFGALGGGVFHGVGSLANRRIEGPRGEREQQELEDIIDRATKVRGMLETATALQTAESVGLAPEGSVDLLIETEIMDLGLRAAVKGNIGLEKEMLTRIAQLTPEQLEERGFSPEAQERAQRGLKLLDDIEDTYNFYAEEINPVEGYEDLHAQRLYDLTRDQVSYWRFVEEQTRLQKQIDKLESKKEADPSLQREIDQLNTMMDRLDEAKNQLNKHSADLRDNPEKYFKAIRQKQKAQEKAKQKAKEKRAAEERRDRVQKTKTREVPNTETEQRDRAPSTDASFDDFLAPATDEEQTEKAPEIEEPPQEGAPATDTEEGDVARSPEVEEPPADRPPVEDEAPSETPSEETPTPEVPTEEDAAKEKPTEFEPTKAPITERPEAEPPVRESPVEEPSIKEDVQPEPKIPFDPEEQVEPPVPKDPDQEIEPTAPGEKRARSQTKVVHEAKAPQPEPDRKTPRQKKDTDSRKKERIKDNPYRLAYYFEDESGNIQGPASDEAKALVRFLESTTDYSDVAIHFDYRASDSETFDDFSEEQLTHLRKGTPLVRKEDGYVFEGTDIAIDPGALSIGGWISKGDTELTHKGKQVRAYMHRASKVPANKRDEFREVRAKIYNDSVAGKSVTSRLKVIHAGFRRSTEGETYVSLREVADGIGLFDLAVVDENLTYRLSSTPGNIFAGAKATEEMKGTAHAIVTMPGGQQTTWKLNTRPFTPEEATLIYHIFNTLVNAAEPGKVRYESLPENVQKGIEEKLGTFSNVRLLDLANLLVNFGEHTQAYEGEKQATALDFIASKKKILVGNTWLTAKEFAETDTAKDFIEHVIKHKRHQVNLKALGPGRDILNLFEGETKVTLFGKEYSRNALWQMSSYYDYLSDRTDEQGRPVVAFDAQPNMAKEGRLFRHPTVVFETPQSEEDRGVARPKEKPESEPETKETEEVKDPNVLYRLVPSVPEQVERFESVEAEIAWLQKQLPNVPIKVVQDLIRTRDNTGWAYGAFLDGMIKLSREMAPGTAYHEAFHAVFNLYLSPEERTQILSEARELFGKEKPAETPDTPVEEMTDEEIEAEIIESGFHTKAEIEYIKGRRKKSGEDISLRSEREELEILLATKRRVDQEKAALELIRLEELLADDFMSFVQEKRRGQSVPTLMGAIKDFFYRLWEMIRSVFSDAITRERLYKNITKGVYKGEPKQGFDGARYMSVMGQGEMSHQQITDAVSFMVMTMMREANVRTTEEVTQLSFVDANGAYVWEPYLKGLEKKGHEETAQLIRTYQGELLDHIRIFLHGLGIRQRPETDEHGQIEDPEFAEENQDIDALQRQISAPFEFSNKATATQNVRLLVATIPDQYENSSLEGLGRLVPYSIWNKLESELSGLVDGYRDGVFVSGYEKMMEKLEAMAKSDRNIGKLIERLEEFGDAEYKRTQFYNAFSKVNQGFRDFLWTRSDGFEFNVADASTQSAVKRTLDGWANGFLNSSVVGYDEQGHIHINTATVDQKIAQYGKIDETLDAPTPQNLESLRSFLNSLGITISEEGLSAYLHVFGDSYETQLKRLRGQLGGFALGRFGKKTATSLYRMGSEAEFRLSPDSVETRTPISDFLIFEELARAEAFSRGEGAETTVFGPEGKPYWVYSLPNGIQETILRLADRRDSIVEELLALPFYERSRILKQLQRSPDLRSQLEVGTYLNFKEKGVGDKGAKFPDLKEGDEIVMRLLMAMTGRYTTLSLADKSNLYFIEGLPTLQRAYEAGEDGAQISNEAKQAFFDYFYTEYVRMGQARAQKETLPEEQLIQYYHDGNAFKSEVFPELSPDRLQESNPELYARLYDSEGAPLLWDDVTEEQLVALQEAVLPVIEQNLRDRVEDHLNFLVETDLLQKTEKNYAETSNSWIPNEIRGDKDIQSLIGSAVINQIAAHWELMGLFYGDYAAYKSVEDLSKRTPGAAAFGQKLRTDIVPLTFKAVVMKDVEKTSEFIEQYEKAFKAVLGDRYDDSILAKYRNINTADGQGYITLKRFRDIMTGLGRWTPEHERHYPALKRGEFPEAIQELYRDYLELQHAAMQPLKGVHFEVTHHNGAPIPVYLKYSTGVLFPALTKNTPLESLRNQLEKQGIDEAIFESGVKVGARAITNVFDENGLIPENLQLSPIVLSNSKWRLQVDMPQKGAHDTLEGSQARKNILAQIIPDGEYVLKGKKISGRDLLNAIHDVHSALSNIGWESLVREWGIDDQGRITNVEGLAKTLREEFEGRDASTNLLSSLRTAGNEFVLPLDASPARTQIQNMIFAVLRKRTVRTKTFGGSYIQLSSTGLTKPRGYSELSDEEQSRVFQFGELKPPTYDPETGTWTPGDVLLPHWFGEKVEELVGRPLHTLTEEEIRFFINEDALRIVSYRIPNQGKNSIDVLNVKGFLPKETGDTIVMFDEVTAKTGSDFDIDKMYVMIKNFRFRREDGEIATIEAIPFLEESTSLEERYATWVLDKLPREVVSEYYEDDVLKYLPKFEKAVALAQGNNLPSPEEFEELPIIQQNTKRAIENRIIELYEAVLSHPEGFVESNTPLGVVTDKLTKLSSQLTKWIQEGEAPSSKGLSMLTPLRQMQLKETFTIGKALTGSVANHLVHHSISQAAGLYYNGHLPGAVIVNPKVSRANQISDLAGTTNKDGDLISYVLSALLDGTVDVAKDPWIFGLGFNSLTANTALLLIRAGAKPGFVFSLLNQPIVRDYVRAAQIYESGLIEATDEKGRRLRPEDVVEARWKAKLGDESVPLFPDAARNPFSAKTMRDSIRGRLNDKLFVAQQLDILKLFTRDGDGLIAAGKQLHQAVLAAKVDTQGAGKDTADALAIESRFQALVEPEQHQIGNFTALFKRDGALTMHGTYWKNTLGVYRKALLDHLVEIDPRFQLVIHRVFAMMGTAYGTDPEIIRTIMRHTYAAALSGTKLAPTPEKLESLFRGKDTLADRLKQFQKEDSPIADNELIRYLKPVKIRKKNVGFIKGAGTEKGRVYADQLTQSWRDLLSHEDETIRQFAEDLVQYAYASSAWQKGLFTFHELIPVDYLTENLDIGQAVREMPQKVEESVDAIANQIFRHLYQDRKFVPEIFSHRNSKKVGKLGFHRMFILEPSANASYAIGRRKVTNKNGEKRWVKLFPQYLSYQRKLSDQELMEGVEPEKWLYRLVGYNSNWEPIYHRIAPLGTEISGMRAYEYDINAGAGGRVTRSIFNNAPKWLLKDNRPTHPPQLVEAPVFPGMEPDELSDPHEGLDGPVC